ncbi:hypothetical protein [Methanocorpusculum vombati]|uniref:hypothetical protein n=1 Tax=Methanocorpusculum vombati TaxID=3002864 RepID=UPI0022A78492|nr:hypothetical protein [Methanocorpusculum vombati]MCZ9319838.1 hypothetical protein [Methanocorpusculum sp.]MDE2520592.1 hypothetical protein [Methanocorpusculum sp.]MDE2534810.1 hypothetical protein [Methanocorpusculum sp.]MDE2546989.1 hypothetical protein [Methanocorpusculum sp.]MDE2548758.1 hypothetical protein [Methanocorpusculum sp.]
MDSGDPVWTVLFVLIAVVIVILFVRMVKKNLCDAGSCCGCCHKSGGKDGGCSHCKGTSHHHSPLKK